MAIGDTVNAGLMRIDSSPLLRAGEANAQANQAFGDAVGNFVDGFYKKKKEKEDRQERESFFISQGFTDEEAKAASGDQNLAKFLEAKRNADRTFEFETRKYADLEETRDRDRINENAFFKRLGSASGSQVLNAEGQQEFERGLPFIAPGPEAENAFRDELLANPKNTEQVFELEGNAFMKKFSDDPEMLKRAIKFSESSSSMDPRLAFDMFKYERAQRLEEEEKNKLPQEPVYAQAALDAIGQAKKLAKEGFMTVGLGAEAMAGIGGTDSANMAAAISTIISAIGFKRLQDMRDASPTGGALGQVSERELNQLNASLGSLAQSQSKEQFLENIEKIEKHYKGFVDSINARRKGLSFDDMASADEYLNIPQKPAQPTPSEGIRIGTDGEFTPIKD